MSDLQTERILRYVRDLAQREVAAIGWIPNTVYAPAIARNQIRLVYENNQPCGFIFHGPPMLDCRIYQTAVEPGCRLADHGREAWLLTLQEALHHDTEKITWICAETLPANAFWRRVSGEPKQLTHHKKRGRRPRYHYEHLLPRGAELERYLHEQLHHSPIWKLAKMQGIDHQLESWFKKRFRAR